MNKRDKTTTKIFIIKTILMVLIIFAAFIAVFIGAVRISNGSFFGNSVSSNIDKNDIEAVKEKEELIAEPTKTPEYDNNEEIVTNTKDISEQIETPKAKTEIVEERIVKDAVETPPTQDMSTEQTTTNYSAPTVSGNVKNNPGYVDTSSFTYLGSYRITGYTPGCVHCCGNSKGITASTVPAVIGRTVAAKGLSFGQTLYIKGYGFYVVEDRGGFKSGIIDMPASSHAECNSITKSGVDVYLVPNN